MNLHVLKKSRHQPEVGDVFALKLEGTGFLFGRVVSIDANPLGVGGGILIYIYRANSSCKTSVPTLDRNCLVIPPVITNKLPWSRGYFEHMQARPLTPGDVLSQHRFWDPLRGVYRNEQGNVVPDPAEQCSTWGLHSFRTIDDELSKALGLPLARD
jgi:hypothetical protein